GQGQELLNAEVAENCRGERREKLTRKGVKRPREGVQRANEGGVRPPDSRGGCPYTVLLDVFVLYHLATFHHKLHLLQSGDVFQRVAVDGDNVGELAGFEGADFVGPAEQVGRRD